MSIFPQIKDMEPEETERAGRDAGILQAGYAGNGKGAGRTEKNGGMTGEKTRSDEGPAWFHQITDKVLMEFVLKAPVIIENRLYLLTPFRSPAEGHRFFSRWPALLNVQFLIELFSVSGIRACTQNIIVSSGFNQHINQQTQP